MKGKNVVKAQWDLKGPGRLLGVLSCNKEQHLSSACLIAKILACAEKSASWILCGRPANATYFSCLKCWSVRNPPFLAGEGTFENRPTKRAARSSTAQKTETMRESEQDGETMGQREEHDKGAQLMCIICEVSLVGFLQSYMRLTFDAADDFIQQMFEC